jgi:hypothetical protein
MVSVFILGLISTAAIMDLTVTRRKDQLDTAVRLVASDLRSLQDRALNGQNVLSCIKSGSVPPLWLVCETDISSCQPGSCGEHPPSAVGFHAIKGATSTRYDLFADVDATKADWKETDATEVFLTRDLAQNGAPNVAIDDLITSGSLSSVDVAFQRQNGDMGINGCFSLSTPCTPVTLRILLRQTQSNEVREVDLNSITGRVSIQ